MYSPRTGRQEGEPVQAFTAVGLIRDDDADGSAGPSMAEDPTGPAPSTWRRRV